MTHTTLVLLSFAAFLSSIGGRNPSEDFSLTDAVTASVSIESKRTVLSAVLSASCCILEVGVCWTAPAVAVAMR